MYMWALDESKITNIWPIVFTVLKLARRKTARKQRKYRGDLRNNFTTMELNSTSLNNLLWSRPAQAVLQTDSQRTTLLILFRRLYLALTCSLQCLTSVCYEYFHK
jgi:hypothetical protein